MSLSAPKSEELFKGRVMLEERSERCCEQAWVLRLTRSSSDPAYYGDYFLAHCLMRFLTLIRLMSLETKTPKRTLPVRPIPTRWLPLGLGRRHSEVPDKPMLSPSISEKLLARHDKHSPSLPLACWSVWVPAFGKRAQHLSLVLI